MKNFINNDEIFQIVQQIILPSVNSFQDDEAYASIDIKTNLKTSAYQRVEEVHRNTCTHLNEAFTFRTNNKRYDNDVYLIGVNHFNIIEEFNPALRTLVAGSKKKLKSIIRKFV